MKQEIAMHMDWFESVQTTAKAVSLDGFDALCVVKEAHVQEVDEPTFAKLSGSAFHNGVIEVQVLSRLLPDAPDYARGFIGVAFRIGEDNRSFESFYIRPANGRNSDQVRRNRSTQYFSFPDYKFERFRAEYPGKYESYADMCLNEWIDLRIEVEHEHARLYLHNAPQPVLVVNDLKHGRHKQGAVGLWVDVGTEGFFRNLKITDC